MCNFFSFVTRGNGIPIYFDVEERKKLLEINPEEYEMDSHTSIVYKFIFKNPKFEDQCNKYEYTKNNGLIVDQINTIDDSEKVKKWIEKFIKSDEFLKIVYFMIEYKDSYAIKWLSDEQRTPELCKLAIRKCGYAIQYLTDEQLRYLKENNHV